jgi:flagellar biosynthesis protein
MMPHRGACPSRDRSTQKIKHVGRHSRQTLPVTCQSERTLAPNPDRPPNPDPQSRSGAPPKTLAVALRHSAGTAETPQVIASGRGFTAERILEIAFASGVKVRADADLAEMLAAVGIGEEIPFAAFSAVAEILAYIYRANQSAAPGIADDAAGGRTP